MTMPHNWVDYRPRWDELAGMDEIKSYLHPYTFFDMPHLLFNSPQPGTGKTTLAYAIADRLEIPLHHFNASSKRTRGIEFIEEDVGPLSRCGREMIILLDEADQLTPAAQMALKGVMENCGAIFILTTNNVAKVDKPIQSRCVVFNFKPFLKDVAKQWLISCWNMNHDGGYWDLPSNTLDKIADAHNGDMRAMINSLQTVSAIEGDEEKVKFLLSLYSSDFNCKLFYEHINDKTFKQSFEMMKKAGDIRNTLKVITDYTITVGINIAVIDHIATAYRDYYLGMPEQVVMAAFCKNMVESAPLYP